MNNIRVLLRDLYAYCKACGYRGYDPYDGLNSRLFQASPLNNFKLTRQLWTQSIKFCPFNLRPLLLVKKGYNPKGLALFILGLLKIYKKNQNEEYLCQLDYLLSLLKNLSLKGYSGKCWGYNFPWQSRSFFVPKNTPNAICTVFAADAFLNAYETLNKSEYLQTSLDTIDFFLAGLKKSFDTPEESCFSYTPEDSSQVHNINLWVAYILARFNFYINKKELSMLAYQAARFCVNRQNQDGSWYYGTAENQKWIDSFHTGYNLIALKKYLDLTGNNEFKICLRNGYNFFDKNFFYNGIIPKYYPDKVYPIDIHSLSTSIITYLMFIDTDDKAKAKADMILTWAIKNMWNDKGFFYFQKHRFYTIKIPYIRWSQAWMFYALSILN